MLFKVASLLPNDRLHFDTERVLANLRPNFCARLNFPGKHPPMKDRIELDKLPQHVAVIMDGNGRWAKTRGAMRVFGHKSAVKAVREVTEGCAELRIPFLTLFTFSTENWNRPKLEVTALMELLIFTLQDELPTLMDNNVKLESIGDLSGLPNNCQNTLSRTIEATKANTGLTLTLALGYSGKWDITQAAKSIVQKIMDGTMQPNDIDEHLFGSLLSTKDKPDVDLMIRTGGDRRISNFMLWQLAYAELFFFDELFWPDFRKEHLHEAILSYQMRERRFGKTSEQIIAEKLK